MIKKYILTAIIFIGFMIAGFAQKTEKPLSHFNISAMVNADVIYDIKQMDPAWFAGFRPSKIPVYPTDPGWGTNGHTYFSLQQSTFKFDGVIPVNHKWNKVVLHVTFDLFGTGIHAGETVPRFRTGYGTWGPFLMGKQWSTFVDLDAFPGTWDWWGPSGMALLPSPMIRYTADLGVHNKMETSLEVPGSEIDPGQLRQIDPVLVDFKTKQVLPDFVLRYTNYGDWGHFRAAVLLRQLSYEKVSIQLEKAEAHHKFGWGVNITSVINLFKKTGKLKLQTVFGEGYAGYNNDGGVEIAPDENLKATVPFQHGFVVGYDQNITGKIKFAVTYSETIQNNSAGQLDNAFHHSRYFVSQFVYNVIEDVFMFGLNYQWGERITKSLDHADDSRIMFSARYYFKWSSKKEY